MHVCKVTSVVSNSAQHYALKPTSSWAHEDSSGKIFGVGSHALLQGIFLTQALNLHLLHWQMGSLTLASTEKPNLTDVVCPEESFLILNLDAFSIDFGEGNDNPLQCSCLENPRDREPGGLPSVGSHRVRHD